MRLERFLKNAHKGTAGSGGGSTMANTSTSGSFGGKPKTTRGGHAHGSNKWRQVDAPAWAVANDTSSDQD